MARPAPKILTINLISNRSNWTGLTAYLYIGGKPVKPVQLNQFKPVKPVQLISSFMKESTSLPQQKSFNLTLTEPERWALTKAGLLTMQVQSGDFDPEEPSEEGQFSVAEHEALQSAFRKLNRNPLFLTAL
jgi:hypothetical protein